jgi:replication factor A1
LPRIMKYVEGGPFRGRPRGHQSHSTMTVLSSIAHIAASHDLDAGLLLDAFGEAQTHNEYKYESLEVKCRRVDKELSTFMVTCNEKVLGQFSVGNEILQYPEFFKPYIPVIPTPLQVRKDESPQKSIGELRALMRKVNVNAKVMNIPPRRSVITKYGWYANVSNVLLADETGSIRLSLWNGQIDQVSVGDTVSIDGASVTRFSGGLQLRIGRNGTMTVVK